MGNNWGMIFTIVKVKIEMKNGKIKDRKYFAMAETDESKGIR